MCSTVVADTWYIGDSSPYGTKLERRISQLHDLYKEMSTNIVFISKQIFCEQGTLHMSITNKQRPSSSSSDEATTQNPHCSFQFCRKAGFVPPYDMPIFS